MSETLRLPMKREYFDQIVRGEKPEEYRLVTPYWAKRLVGRNYARIVLTKGYPKGTDSDRILVMPWRGYVEKTITHPHFGTEPVRVFAINVSRTPESPNVEGEPVAAMPGEHEAARKRLLSLIGRLGSKPDYADDVLWLIRVRQLLATPRPDMLDEVRSTLGLPADASVADTFRASLDVARKAQAEPSPEYAKVMLGRHIHQVATDEQVLAVGVVLLQWGMEKGYTTAARIAVNVAAAYAPQAEGVSEATERFMEFVHRWTHRVQRENVSDAERVSVIKHHPTLTAWAALARPVDKGEGAPDPEGWIEWKGGECPVSADILVNVNTRGGYIPANVTEPASEWDWRHDGGVADIVAYRLVPQGKDEG